MLRWPSHSWIAWCRGRRGRACSRRAGACARVHGEGELGLLADTAQEVLEAGHGQWPHSLAGEDVGRAWHLEALQVPESSDLAAAQEVHRRPTVFAAGDVEGALL